jgi:sialate O-acetylesterase
MKSLAVLIVGLATASVGSAAVNPHELFSHGMVLQREVAVPVWGTAKNGESVTVRFADQEVQTTAVAGKWSVKLAPLKAGGPFTMTMAGETTVTLTNVLVGEVWVCSGQSNMAWPLKDTDRAKEVVAAAGDDQLRLFTVPRNPTDSPQTAVAATWQLCTPANAAPFSGVAYYFGRHLRRTLGVPVGLINSSVGGTLAEAWTPKATLAGDPVLKAILDEHEKAVAEFPAALANFRASVTKAPPAAPGAQVKATPPADPAKHHNRPACLYNGMIAPLVPFALRGVIWYQGESNRSRPDRYTHLFSSLIGSWRQAWGLGEFPFLFVQLAPRDLYPPELREAQLQTWQQVSNTAMAVITDWGLAHDSHPRNKEPVGDRLGLAARALVYGEKIEYSGPVYASMSVEGDRAVLSFTHLGGGLMAKGEALKGFTIAGADKTFVPAKAEIIGDTVVVSSPQVKEPVAVRYGWTNVPDVNLFNQGGLPASPFRTDSK